MPTQLWVTDGTSAGTIGLPTPPQVLLSGQPVGFGDGLLFSAIDERGLELWRNDGTPGGTAIVRDIRNPPSSSNPIPLAALGPYLLFAADDGTSGYELWRSDGTTAGTQMLKDIRSGAGDALEEGCGLTLESVVVQGVLYFCATDLEHGAELWRTDGTTEGTWLVKDIVPGPESSYPRTLTTHDGSLFFLASHPSAAGSDISIFRSDGSDAGTAPIFDVPQSGQRFELTSFGGHLYFAADGVPGLWRSDGAAERIEPLPIDQVENIRAVTPLRNLLIFSGAGAIGGGVWATDGTVAGTRFVRDITPARLPGVDFSSNASFFPARDYLYFVTPHPNGRIGSLWRTDGTTDGTRIIATPNEFFSSDIDNLTAVGDGLAFSASTWSRYGNELWMVRPNDEVVVRDIIPGEASSLPRSFLAIGDTLLFSADDGVHGHELWRSQAFGPPVLFHDIVEGRSGSDPAKPMLACNYIYFTAAHPDTGNELWAIPVAEVEPTAAVCVGDCNCDNAVTVDDLTTGVDIALGMAPQSRCLAIDRDASSSTTVDEILAAVERALVGCGT